MPEIVGSALLLAVGLTVGGLLAWLLWGRAAQPAEPESEPLLAPQAAELLGALHSATLLIGPHDEVLHVSERARNLGLVQGARVVHAQLLTSIRDARREDVAEQGELDLRGSGLPGSRWEVRVVPLSEGLVLVLAQDVGVELRVEQTRRDFVANISHELKTPIGAISLLSETVAEAADDPDAVRRFADRMGIEAKRLTQLVTQIIDLSRMQSDDPMLAAELVDVDDVVIDAVDRFRDFAFTRNISLAMTGTSELLVWGDQYQLTEAVANLVQNAISYSDAGARVALTTSVTEVAGTEFVAIAVSDNGIGIKEADLDRVFERFYRVDYGRSRDHGGTGLGLSLVKHIAAAHGGSASVWSQPGQGSTFTIKVPRYVEGVDQT